MLAVAAVGYLSTQNRRIYLPVRRSITFSTQDAAADGRWRTCLISRYYVVMAVVMLAYVVAGFARTLFFRRFFNVPSIPAYLYIHGIIVTAWFVWFLIQTSLIAGHRVALHRKLGVTGVFLAALVVIASFTVVLLYPSRLHSLGSDVEATAASIASVVISDLISLGIFTCLVSLAVAYRRHPGFHKRLMYFASFSIIGPAVIPTRLGALLAEFGISPAITPIMIVLIFLLGPVLFDLVAYRRPHVVTFISLPAIVVGALLGNWLAGTKFGEALVITLS
jgi:hypothetical protein